MQGPHAATTRPQPRRRRWEMLGNEPNQGRVISKNHSMKCKLGTVQVWTTRAEEERGRPEIPKGQAEPGLGPQQRSRPKIQDLRGRPITYVPVSAPVFWKPSRLGVLWSAWSPLVLLPACCPRALGLVLSGSPAAPHQPPSHAEMTEPSCLVWSRLSDCAAGGAARANRQPP